MSDELEETAGAGLGRRDFLKRSAIVGGMVWAAPLISSAPAFAQTGTGIEEDGCQNISYLAFVLHNDGTTRYKYEDNNGSCNIEAGGNLDTNCATQHPTAAAEFSTTTPGTAGDGRATVNCSDDDTWIIQPAANYGVQFALVKGGANAACKLYQGPFPKGQALSVNTC